MAGQLEGRQQREVTIPVIKIVIMKMIMMKMVLMIVAIPVMTMMMTRRGG